MKPDPVCQTIPEDAVVAALDNDPSQMSVHLCGKITPLGASHLRTVNGLDNDIMPKGNLLGGKSPDDEVGSVVRGPGLADACAPHRRFSLIHPKHRTVQCLSKIES
jgi:hypothetical protein